MKLILTKGLIASGKTTWASQYVQQNKDTININKDDLRTMLFGPSGKGNENLVTDARDELTIIALKKGKSVIWSDTNLHPKHLQRATELITVMKHLEVDVTVEVNDSFMSTPLSVCIKRDAMRTIPLGEQIIRRMYNQYIDEFKKYPIQVVEELPEVVTDRLPAIICDLDGTLVKVGDRSPYDAKNCYLVDIPNIPVIEILNQFHKQGYKIIFMSGRNDTDRISSVIQIKQCVPEITEYEFYMRSRGDGRKDSVVKEELYNTYVKDKYNILFVLDDRDQVVELWRSLGLTCLQVAPGNF